MMTPKKEAFVREYLIDLNATQAAIRAGYSAKTAKQQGARLLTDVDVAAAIAQAQEARIERVEITQDRVLEQLWAIATADPNDLVQFRRGSCPKCWSVGPDAEEELEPQGHGGSLKRARKAAVRVIDEDPNPDCDQCGGEGVGRVWVADTRKLAGPARRLYAGVKVTKDGLEVKMHDQAAALVNVGRHLGMFKDKFELTGKDGGAIESRLEVDVSDLTLDQLRALAAVRLAK